MPVYEFRPKIVLAVRFYLDQKQPQWFEDKVRKGDIVRHTWGFVADNQIGEEGDWLVEYPDGRLVIHNNQQFVHLFEEIVK